MMLEYLQQHCHDSCIVTEMLTVNGMKHNTSILELCHGEKNYLLVWVGPGIVVSCKAKGFHCD